MKKIKTTSCMIAVLGLLYAPPGFSDSRQSVLSAVSEREEYPLPFVSYSYSYGAPFFCNLNFIVTLHNFHRQIWPSAVYKKDWHPVDGTAQTWHRRPVWQTRCHCRF